MPVNLDQPLQCSHHTARSPTSALRAECLAHVANPGPRGLFFQCRCWPLAASCVFLCLLLRLGRTVGTCARRVAASTRRHWHGIALAIDRQTHFCGHLINSKQKIRLPIVARHGNSRSNIMLVRLCRKMFGGQATRIPITAITATVTSPTDDHPLRRRIDEHVDFASQSFRTPVEAYFALGLLDHFCHYAGAEAFAVRRGHQRAAGFVPAQNEAAI